MEFNENEAIEKKAVRMRNLQLRLMALLLSENLTQQEMLQFLHCSFTQIVCFDMNLTLQQKLAYLEHYHSLGKQTIQQWKGICVENYGTGVQ